MRIADRGLKQEVENSKRQMSKTKLQMQRRTMRMPIFPQSTIRNLKWSQLSILRITVRNSSFVAAGREGRAMCTSRARAIAHRANTRRAKKASRDIFYSSYARLRMRVWLVIQTQVSPRFCVGFLLRVQKLRHIRSRPCIQLSAWLNFPVTVV